MKRSQRKEQKRQEQIRELMQHIAVLDRKHAEMRMNPNWRMGYRGYLTLSMPWKATIGPPNTLVGN